MKAFIVDRYKGKDGVQAGDVPSPQMRDDDVLVQIHAAGVNPLDVKISVGEFMLTLPYRVPFVLGNDLAGVVVQVGPRVQRFKPGDEVYALPDKDRIGTFAQFIAIDQAAVAHKPRTVSMQEAASLPLVALTAWQALVERAAKNRGVSIPCRSMRSMNCLANEYRSCISFSSVPVNNATFNFDVPCWPGPGTTRSMSGA